MEILLKKKKSLIIYTGEKMNKIYASNGKLILKIMLIFSL